MDDPLATLDSLRIGGARLYFQCKAYAGGGRTYFQVEHPVGGILLGSRRHHTRVVLLFLLLEEVYERDS
jgi:hypothetical protein